jgi:hypothetical protein
VTNNTSYVPSGVKVGIGTHRNTHRNTNNISFVASAGKVGIGTHPNFYILDIYGVQSTLRTLTPVDTDVRLTLSEDTDLLGYESRRWTEPASPRLPTLESLNKRPRLTSSDNWRSRLRRKSLRANSACSRVETAS